MGQSTNGILVYGYNLGGSDGFKVREAGEYGALPDEWDPGDEGFSKEAERRLLALAGFTETDWQVEGFYDRKWEAEERLNVKLQEHCSGSYPMYVLAVKVFTARRGDCKAVDCTVAPEWDGQLQSAIAALGLTPTQGKAQWLLCSYWSN